MTTRTFAPWVEPFAAKQRADRERVLTFARALPAEAWSTPVGDEGWTAKDLVAHIGKGNDQLFQKLLRQVIAGEQIDTEIFRTVDTDGENAAGVEARKNLSPAEVLAEFEEACDEVEELLSQLTDDHEHLTQDDPPFQLKGFIGMVDKESHSIEHLEQLKAAVGVRT